MAISVGTLTVNLDANTAAFTSGLDKAAQQAANSSKNMQDSFNRMSNSGRDAGEKMSFSMMEAKGSMMLLGEEMGVRIPRHLRSLIAEIPGIGVAFATMLPLVGVIAAVGVIAKLIEHHEKLAEAIRKAAVEQQNLAIREGDTTKSLELANLKLDDQIAKLEGRPTKNHLQEALLANSMEVDKLAETFATQFQKIDTAIAGSTTFLDNLWTELKLIGKGDPWSFGTNALPEVKILNRELNGVRTATEEVGAAQLKLFDARDINSQREATKGYSDALGKLREQSEAALLVVRTYTPDNTELISQLRQKIALAAAGLQDMGLKAEGLNKVMRLAKDQSLQDIQGPKDKAAEGEIAGHKLIEDALATSNQKKLEMNNAFQKAVIETAIDTARKLGTLDQSLENQKLALIDKETGDREASARDLYNNEVEAKQRRIALLRTEQGDHATEINTLNSELAALAIKFEGELDTIHKTGITERSAADKQYTNDIIAQDKLRHDAERRLEQEQSAFKKTALALDMANMRQQTDFEFKLGLTNAQQHIQALKNEAATELLLEKKKNADLLNEIEKNDPNYPLAYQKMLDANIIAEKKYDNAIVKLDQDAIDERKKAWDAGFNAMNSGMSTLVGNLINGNGSITADLKSMLKNMLTSWVDYFVQLEMRALEASLFMKAIGLLGSVGGAAGSSASGGVSGMFNPGSVPTSGSFASGGSVSPGSIYTVGETGKEWFVPTTAGTIVPNSKMMQTAGGSPIVINQNISIATPDKNSFLASNDQIASVAFGAAIRAARRNG
jgi:hypothetical protein